MSKKLYIVTQDEKNYYEYQLNGSRQIIQKDGTVYLCTVFSEYATKTPLGTYSTELVAEFVCTLAYSFNFIDDGLHDIFKLPNDNFISDLYYRLERNLGVFNVSDSIREKIFEKINKTDETLSKITNE